ncbi:MAG TPA: YciI family protein [Saprospiraceae bacterium]|nr:YciI family protein [Saprospiraceae bacterium]
MKTTNLFCILFGIALFFSSCGPSIKVEVDNESEKKVEEMSYDSVLAQKLGADEYGMKKYVMAFLKTGPNQEQDSVKAAELQRAHLDNIFRLADEGKLALAGPFLDGGDLRGVYIFNVETVEEAKALTETDPAIKAGRFIMELHPWYGSAAACMITEQHKRLAKKTI